MESVNELIELIPTLGFPIVCVIGLSVFVWYMFNHIMDTNKENMQQIQESCRIREEKLYTEIAENREINKRAIETIAEYSVKIDQI